jgi:hypothetical protein
MDRISLKQRSQSISVPGPRRAGEALAPPGAALKKLAAATAVALLVLPGMQAARAQSIGELDVRSRLGERFYGAVPVQVASGFLDPNCIRVAANPNAPPGAEALQGARVRIGSADSVIIETRGAVNAPVVGLRLEVGCERPVIRDYVVLGEGAAIAGLTDAPVPPVARPAAAAAPSAAARPGARAAPRARAAARAPSRQAGARVEVPTAPSATLPPARQSITVAPSPPPVAVSPIPPQTATLAPPPAVGMEASDAARRVAELRARSDDYAAALLALDDRLALLQKQADLLKSQLEGALATPQGSASAAASAPVSAPQPPSAAATSPAPPPATPVAASGTASPAPADDASRRREPGVIDLLSDWGVAGGLAALLLGAFILRRRHRPVFKAGAIATAADDALLEPAHTGAGTAARTEFRPDATMKMPTTAASVARDTRAWHLTTAPMKADQTAEWVAPPTTDTMPVSAAPGPEPTLPGTGPSREFHISQRFQPTTERVVALASPEEIVQQARTHYMDDGDVFRAIDLLEMAVSARKDSPRPWQALLAIYQREHMTERFQRLAQAYRGAFGEDESWPTVRALGQTIDPLNPLYGGEGSVEPLPADLTERWLGVPLDFTAHLLANEMHDQLMGTSPDTRRRRTAQE